MFKKERLLSFIVAALMLFAATIAVNKTIFNQQVSRSEVTVDNEVATVDPVSELEDGSIVIHTKGMEGTVAGYAGPVPLDIRITDGKISAIESPENAETPGFFKRASTLFDSWIGKTPAEASEVKVDAVSGATYSSNAIISNMNVGLAFYDGVAAKSGSSMPWKEWIALAVTLAACIVPLFVKNKVYHTVQMFANVIVLGFWCGQFLDYSLILKYISEGFAFPIGLTAIAMLAAAFIYPIFGKPEYYCTHICPLGSAQQLMGRIFGYKIKMTAGRVKALDWFRRILWAVLMLSLWTDCLTDWMNYELFQAFQFESASWWVIGVAIAFILLSAVVNRPYCRFVCPTGSLFKRSENMG